MGTERYAELEVQSEIPSEDVLAENLALRARVNALEKRLAGLDRTRAVVFINVGQQCDWWEYGEVFSASDPLLRGNVIYARDMGEVENQKLVAAFPGRSFYRLDGPLLTILGN